MSSGPDKTIPKRQGPGWTRVADRASAAQATDDGGLFFATDFESFEALVARGVVSSRVLCGALGSEAEWAATGPRPGAANPPPRPYRPELPCLVVLPTYNERDNLVSMVEAIRRHLVADVLVVDDGSPDGTGEIADALAREHPHLQAMHRPGKLGLGTAYLDGFRWGLARGYERLVEMDSDFSHDPRDLPRLLHASHGSDLVIGSRYVAGGDTDGWGASRRLLSRGANLYTRLFLGPVVRDWTAGFRCFSADVLRRLDLARITANGYSFQIQMAWAVHRSGGVIREVPIHFAERRVGESKLGLAIALEALRLVPALRLGSSRREASA